MLLTFSNNFKTFQRFTQKIHLYTCSVKYYNVANNQKGVRIMNIGHKIRELRKENKLTLKELSKKTDLSISFISDIENERRNPRLDNLRKIASALNVEVSELLGESESFIIKENPSNYTVDELEIEIERLKPKIRQLPQEEKDKLFKMINAYLEE